MDFIVLRSENWSFRNSSAKNASETNGILRIEFDWLIQPPTQHMVVFPTV